jgi:hypothetical protein
LLLLGLGMKPDKRDKTMAVLEQKIINWLNDD